MEIKPLYIAIGAVGLVGAYVFIKNSAAQNAPSQSMFSANSFNSNNAIDINLSDPPPNASVQLGSSISAHSNANAFSVSDIVSSNAGVITPVPGIPSGFVAVGKGSATISGHDFQGRPVSATVLVA